MRQLEHPNVMNIREIREQNKGYEISHYLVLDLGIDLMDLTRHKEVSLSFEVIKCIVQQLVDGLTHIHSRNVMHRDIKPSNIYLMKDGTCLLYTSPSPRDLSTSRMPSSA